MTKGQKFLKVTSILMIVGGILSAITCLLGFAGVALLAAMSDGHASALLLYLALALALAAAVAEIIAGTKGLKTCKTGENADKCVVWGGIIAGITVVSTIINLVGGGNVSITSILLSLVVPGLYIYGAIQVKKGDWQPAYQQATPQPVQTQQAQPQRTSERPAFQNPYSQTQQTPPPQAQPEQAAPAAFCPACGTKSSGESFCQNCGAALR